MTEFLEQHPIGQILPPMSPEEHYSLRNDLVVHGLRVPIVRYEGKILDGGHRYELCVEENIEPRFEEYAGNDPFGFVRSLNLSRRHLTLAQKKEVARHIFEREPGRTPNSVAEEVGISPPTAQKVQNEVANSKNSNNGNGAIESHASDGPAEPVAGTPGEEMPPAPTPERIEVTGRKARGRKPLSPVEKARRAEERRAARVDAARGRLPEATKLKPLTSVRDDEIDTIAQQIGGNLKLLPEIVNIISGYDGLIQRHFTLGQRHEMARQFAKALGVSCIE